MSAADAIRKLVGYVLFTGGLLMATSCGLCTGYFCILTLVSGSMQRDLATIGPFLAIGAVCTGIGVVLVRFGWALLQDR